MIEFGYDTGEIAKGVLAALTLGVLLRVRLVAVLAATVLVFVIAWVLFATPDSGREMLDAFAARLGAMAGTGMLTGLLAGATLASLLGGLVRTAQGRSRQGGR